MDGVDMISIRNPQSTIRNRAIRNSQFAIGCAAILIGLLAPLARADEVKIATGGRSSLPYANVQVLEVRGGNLVFRMAGNRVEKPMASVESIRLNGQLDFNEAESMIAMKDYARAGKAFLDLAAKPADERVRPLARWRAMYAFDKAGAIDQSVQLWLAIVQADPAMSMSLPALDASRPRTLGEKGSPANKAAIVLLESRLPTLKQGALQLAVQQSLSELYEREGQADKALAIAKTLAGGDKPAPTTTAPSTGPAGPSQANSGAALPGMTTPSVSVAGAKVRLATLLLKEGKSAEALRAIQDNLNAFREDELPEALLVSAKARADQARKASDAAQGREMLTQAGLDYMRVASYWPQAGQAPEALMGASAVNAQLGNAQAARLTYQRVIAKYPQSPQALSARAELDKVPSSKPASSPASQPAGK